MKKVRNEDLGRKNVEEFKSSAKTPVIVVLDNVRSLHNVGSVFRSCDAFACEAIYLCGITARPPHREIEKTALGATQSVDWKYFTTASDAIAELQKNGHNIFVIEQTTESVPLHQLISIGMMSSSKYAIVFGHEINGVSDEFLQAATGAIDIPQQGTKHSLNISVCVGIVLWELFKMHRL
jgi:tRNA G18 (ribose-2'-O)-methylase SpoU